MVTWVFADRDRDKPALKTAAQGSLHRKANELVVRLLFGSCLLGRAGCYSDACALFLHAENNVLVTDCDSTTNWPQSELQTRHVQSFLWLCASTVCSRIEGTGFFPFNRTSYNNFLWLLLFDSFCPLCSLGSQQKKRRPFSNSGLPVWYRYDPHNLISSETWRRRNLSLKSSVFALTTQRNDTVYNRFQLRVWNSNHKLTCQMLMFFCHPPQGVFNCVRQANKLCALRRTARNAFESVRVRYYWMHLGIMPRTSIPGKKAYFETLKTQMVERHLYEFERAVIISFWPRKMRPYPIITTRRVIYWHDSDRGVVFLAPIEFQLQSAAHFREQCCCKAVVHSARNISMQAIFVLTEEEPVWAFRFKSIVFCHVFQSSRVIVEVLIAGAYVRDVRMKICCGSDAKLSKFHSVNCRNDCLVLSWIFVSTPVAAKLNLYHIHRWQKQNKGHSPVLSHQRWVTSTSYHPK